MTGVPNQSLTPVVKRLPETNKEFEKRRIKEEPTEFKFFRFAVDMH